MKLKKFCLTLAVCAVIQVTILPYIRLFTVETDLLLICSVIAALIFRLQWSLFFCILAGIFKDVFGSGVFPVNTVLFPLLGLFVNKLNRKVDINNDYIRIPLIAVIAFMLNLISGLVFIYYGGNLPLGIFTRILLLSPVLAAVFSVPLLRLFKKDFPD